MTQSLRVLTPALVLLLLLVADARGQQLLEIDGIELHGKAQLVTSGGGTCNVLESDTSYEAKKENHGAPMDIWRLDFLVRNGSGRWLDHLIARFQIESEWPDCTNWDGPDAGTFAQDVEWADSIGNIQESSRNVVSPGQTLSETRFFIVLRGDPDPGFSNWSMDFNFAAAPPTAGAGSPTAPPTASAAQQPPPTTTAEQENLFWQSMMNSTNPAEIEAYLAQFPNGVFRALAEARLAALGDPADNARSAAETPASGGRAAPAPDRNPPAAAGNDARAQEQPFGPGAGEPTCAGQARGAACWMELESHPGCYVWNPRVRAGATATWTAGCAGGLASGSGTLKWVWDDGRARGNGDAARRKA